MCLLHLKSFKVEKKVNSMTWMKANSNIILVEMFLVTSADCLCSLFGTRAHYIILSCSVRLIRRDNQVVLKIERQGK